MKCISITYNTSYYIYKFRMNLVKELQNIGYTIVAISPYDESVPHLEKQGIIHHHVDMTQYGMNPLQELRTTIQIFKALKKYNPEFTLNYTIKPNIFGSIAATFAGVRYINNITGAGKIFASDNMAMRPLLQGMYKIALAKSSKIFFQNSDDMGYFISNGMVAKDKCERLPGSGVDLRKFRPQISRLSKNKFLFIGRLLKEKGIYEYIKAAYAVFDQYSDAEFDIVGELEDHKYYISKNDLLKYNKVRYLGAVHPDEMPKIIGEYSCIVLPSYREGTPRSLLEAAAMGKPIITTRSTGCTDVVDEGINGFKCQPRDVNSLIHAIISFIQLPEEKKVQMGLCGRKKMENEYDERFVIAAYINTIVGSS
jgi:glycosyltransferase involved in cell wall biosynthesis